jgi:hypothetical protein
MLVGILNQVYNTVKVEGPPYSNRSVKLYLQDCWNFTNLILGLYQPEDLAVDWVTGNIYFTDSEAKRIGVCTNNGSACSILVDKYMDKPRAIVLLPTEG